MRKHLIRKFHRSMAGSRGYTLMELLVVIGILAVLCGIAIPSVVSVSGALKFAQRNDHARRIFLAAQANLTQLRAEGRLDSLRGESGNVFPVQEGLCGFPVEDWSAEYVYTGSSVPVEEDSGDAYALVLPADSVDADLRQRQVIIEYNPLTGNVYAVFYCREEQVEGTGKSLLALYRGGELPRNSQGDEEKRRNMMVGYYSGSGSSYAPLETEHTQARMTFENGEEGIVTVMIPMPELYVGDHNAFMQGLEVKLTVTGEERGGVIRDIPVKASGTVGDNCKLDVDGRTVLVSYVLDSLYQRKSFANLSLDPDRAQTIGGAEISLTKILNVEDFRILPGENVRLDAQITFHPANGRPDVQVHSANLAGVNPMFGFLTRNLFREGYTLTIANGRNLQNLNAIAPGVAEQITDVVFTEDIYWNRTTDYYDRCYGAAGVYSNPADEAPARALPYFVPIHNENLFGTARFVYLDGSGEEEKLLEDILGSIVGPGFGKNLRVPTLTDELDTRSHAKIRGEGHRVYNLHIDASRYRVPNQGHTDVAGTFYATGRRQVIDYRFTGLFGYVNTAISDLHLVNPIIRGCGFGDNGSEDSNPATGALAGACGYHSQIQNCSVYLDPGAEGFNRDAQDRYGVSGAGAVGGLVGYAKALGENASFRRCFAAVPVSGYLRGHDLGKDYGYSNGVGGLVGNAQLVNFDQCYASGNVRVENTYSRTVRYGADTLQTVLGMHGDSRCGMGGGGFVGTSHGARFTNCFASGSVTRISGSGTMANAGGFVGMMCYDATRAFGHQGGALLQHTVFENCYAVGMCADSNGGILEGFAGGTGTMGVQYGPIAPEYSPDYYRLFAPYYLWNAADPQYQTYYVFRDSYYLSRYGDTGQDQSRKCADPMGYSELMNLHRKYDDGAWIRNRIHQLKNRPLDAQAAAAALDFAEGLMKALPDAEQLYRDYLVFRESMETGHPSYWYQIYWDIDAFLREKGLRTAPSTMEERYFACYAAGFPSQIWETSSEGDTYCYGEAAGDVVYPFPKLSGMDYYGTWPQVPLTGGLAYYEIYETGDGTTAGYYFDRADTSTLRSTGDLRILHDGYGVFSGSGEDVIRIYDADGVLLSDVLRPDPNSVTLPGDSRSYYVTKLPDSLADKLMPGGQGFYSALRIQVSNSSGTMSYWALFNPSTGISQVNHVTFGADGEIVYPENPGKALIRTARQLNGLGNEKMRSLWTDGDLTFLQQLHIDASTYDWDNDGVVRNENIPVLSPIGDGEHPFSATYTGTGGYVSQAQIKGFRQETPLFGSVGTHGSIRDLIIRMDGDTVIGSGENDYAALLAAVCAGQIENVDLDLAGTVTLNAKIAAGVLVGCVSGTGKNRAIISACDITAGTLEIMAENAGGLLGMARNADLEDLNIRLKGITAGALRVGGLAGILDSTGIRDLTVTISGTIIGDNAAGVAGSIESGDLANITVKLDGTITAEHRAAGFAVALRGQVENALVIAEKQGAVNGGMEAALFACEIGARVTDSRVAGKLSATGENAAGFAIKIAGTDLNISGNGVTPALENTAEGYLGRSNGDLTVNGTTAALFALEISQGVLVTDCYVLGTVSGERVSGFADTNSGTIDGTTANVTLTGGYAFVRENTGEISNSYGWYGNGAEALTSEETATVATMEGSVVSSYFVDMDIPVTEDRTSAHIYDWNRQYRTGSLLTLTVQELNGETGGRWFAPGTFDPFPYRGSERVSYPFPMLRVHFGEWGQ